MILDLRIQSSDGQRCAILLNGRFHCEASFPLQEEWLVQALRAASRNAGIEFSALFSHQNIIPSIIPALRTKKSTPAPALTLDELLS